MRWTERQRAMLREMGIVLWAPEVLTAERASPDVGAPAQGDVETVVERGPGRFVASPTAALDAQRPSAGRSTEAALAAPRPAAARDTEAALATPRLPGLAEADWLVVGEPLDAGDPQQEQLLENMLRAIGVGLIAPTRDRRAAFHALAGGGAGGASDRAALEAALGRVGPRCVLALGRAAAVALLGDDSPLGSVRGRVHAFAGVPVVVTFSLAFLLRHPMEKAKAWTDLCLAVGALGGPST